MSYALSAAALFTLVGTGMNYVANHNAANRQDSELAAGLRQQAALQQQQAQNTQQLIQKTTQSSPEAAKSSLLASFTDALNKASPRGTAALNQVGNVSNAFTKAANDASQGIADYGNTNAGLLSSIDAPQLQRQGEAANLSRYGTATSALARQSQADEFLTNMRLKGIQPNPWLTGIGSVLTGAGQAIGASGGLPMGGAGAGNGGGKVIFSGGYGTNLPFK